MASKNKPTLHDGKKGIALAIRVTPRSAKNEIFEVMRDGTVKVRLTATAEDQSVNQALVELLSDVLDVPVKNMEVVAGSGNDRLVSILDIDALSAHQKILEHLS